MTVKVDYQVAPTHVVLNDIGDTLASIRLARNITQKDLSDLAGISVRTLKRLEAGEGASLDTFVRILQALNLGHHLAALLPDPGIQPVTRLELGGRDRQRARPKKDADRKPWAWDEDKTP